MCPDAAYRDGEIKLITMRLWNVSENARCGRIRDWVLAGAFACLAGWTPAVEGPSPDSGPTFTVTPSKRSWALIAYGDTRFTDPADHLNSNPEARQALVRKIAEEKPSVLLISGDLPFHGGEANDYVQYQRETQPWRQAGIRVFPAIGNHELYDPRDRNGCNTCLANWWNTFPELRGRRWYSVRFGEAYIITLDSNLELTPGSEQSQWLSEQLKELPKGVRYVFISMHHPPIGDPVHLNTSHNARPNEQAVAQQLEEVAKRIKAKIVVIAGHIHNYERFQRGGVDYLVSGGGGAKPYQVDRSPMDLYQDTTFPVFHYVKFIRDGHELRATMYRLEGDGFVAADSFTVGETEQVKNVWWRLDLAARIRWAIVCFEQLIDDSHQLFGIGRLL